MDMNSLIGNFKNNYLLGQGKIIRDGNTYVGELKNERENGKGMINNQIYGIFKDGKLVEEIVYEKEREEDN